MSYCCSCCRKEEVQAEGSVEKTSSPVPSAKTAVSVVKNVLPKINKVPTMSLAQIDSCVKETSNVYITALSVMQNFVGKPCYPYFTGPKQLYPYILHLCSDLDKSVIEQNYKPEGIKNMELTIMIKEAKIVHPKYTDFKNVYCKIWTDGGVEKSTVVRHSGALLLWDDWFVINLPNYPSDTLHIEVWSIHPGLTPKDLQEQNKKTEESSYLVGDIIESVADLPCVGQDVLWTLKKGPRRVYTRGQIKLFIQLCTKKDKDHILHIYLNMELVMKAYVKNLQFLENTNLWKNWLEILPNPALTLIQQHAIQHGIRPTEQCICSWIISSTLKMKGEDRISFYFLNSLLEDLVTDISKDPVADYVEEAFLHSVAKFSSYALMLLENLHENFNVESADLADELFYLLK